MTAPSIPSLVASLTSAALRDIVDHASHDSAAPDSPWRAVTSTLRDACQRELATRPAISRAA